MSLKKIIVLVMIVILTLILTISCSSGGTKQMLRDSSREDRGGWAFVRLEGTSREIGYQHGWHLAAEIDDLLQAMSFYLERTTKRPWSFYREAAERMLWPKVERPYQMEIEGIVEGMRAKQAGLKWDRFDITALNAWIELAQYYVPYLDEKAKPGSGEDKAPPSCSAFIATGSYTADGRIVLGHNNWTEYIVGERWNVILDIVPDNGHRILMDAMPGYIHSGDDFVINGAGIVYTETTVSQFKGFKEDGIPEFARARKAAQYAASIDDFIRIMSTGNNGGYANDWLVGDLKTNEIARLELGLKNQPVWRTTDGCFIGSNFPVDPKFIAEETTFDPANTSQSVYIRKARWEKLMEETKGRIDAEVGKMMESDHVDAETGLTAAGANTLCGHVETDPKGVPEFSWGPFTPGGAVQGKVATAAMAEKMQLWARMGHPCGEDFIAADFLAKRPEFAWQAPFLRDMKGNPWTLFEGRTGK